MPRYIIHPGPVRSRSDGARRFVLADELISLYGVDKKSCYCLSTTHQIATYRPREDDIHLYPRSSGDYRIQTSN